jgi:hypothetical protein
MPRLNLRAQKAKLRPRQIWMSPAFVPPQILAWQPTGNYESRPLPDAEVNWSAEHCSARKFMDARGAMLRAPKGRCFAELSDQLLKNGQGAHIFMTK